LGQGDIRVLVTKNQDGTLRSDSFQEILDIPSIEDLFTDFTLFADDIWRETERVLSAFERKYKNMPEVALEKCIPAQLALRDVFLPEPNKETAQQVLSFLT